MSNVDRRSLASVTLAPAALWLLCRPFAGVAVNDDFSYAYTVQRLLETGRLTYNGWSTTMVGAQAYWGAAFAAAFGFSHDVLRLSTLALACAASAMTYALHRKLDVPPRWATFATLLLVASPVFTPWSASFMTDVPGLAATLALLHASLSLTRAARQAAFAWSLAFLVALGAVGGTIRQTNFVFAIVAACLEAIRRRRSPAEVAALLAAAAVEAGIAVAVFGWQSRQPFATPEGWPADGTLARAAVAMGGLALTFVAMLLPLGLAASRLGLRLRLPAAVALAAACLAVCGGAAWLFPTATLTNFARWPWSGNTITPTGLLFDGVDAPGVRPVVIGVGARVVVAAAVYWTIVVAAAAVVRRRRAIFAALPAAIDGPAGAFAAFALACQAAAYVTLLLPRASTLFVFDRYLLVLIPLCSAALLRACRRRLTLATPGVAAWSLLALYAFVGVAITHDHFAELRLRDRIAADLAREGVPRDALANGLTFDAWTQMTARHYVNDPRIVNPPGAYVADPDDAARSAIFWYLPFTPAVRPTWVVACVPSLPAALGDRRPYRFRAILPPRDRFLLAWPLRRATTRSSASVDESTGR